MVVQWYVMSANCAVYVLSKACFVCLCACMLFSAHLLGMVVCWFGICLLRTQSIAHECFSLTIFSGHLTQSYPYSPVSNIYAHISPLSSVPHPLIPSAANFRFHGHSRERLRRVRRAPPTTASPPPSVLPRSSACVCDSAPCSSCCGNPRPAGDVTGDCKVDQVWGWAVDCSTNEANS